MTALVVDESLAAGGVVADEHDAVAEALLEPVKVEDGRVPDLFWHEMRNRLLMIERRGRSAQGAADVALTTLRRVPIRAIENHSDDAVLTIARTYNLTPYDAAYLDLATGSRFSLATADRRLAAGAHAAGVAVPGPYADPAP